MWSQCKHIFVFWPAKAHAETNKMEHITLRLKQTVQLYTTLTNLSTKYHVMCKVYTEVGGIK